MAESAQACCDDREREGGADFGLGRCRNRGTWRMAVFYATSTAYNVPSGTKGERFCELRDSRKLKAALRRWLE